MMSSEGGADIWSTAFEQWPDGLRRWIEPVDEVALTATDLMAIGQYTPGFLAHFEFDTQGALELDPDTIDQIDLLFSEPNPANGYFVRLGICSFKAEGPMVPVRSRDDLLRIMLRPNPRVAGFLRVMLTEDMHATLFFRPWLPLLPWGQFKVIILNGRVAGVTQSDAGRVFPEIIQQEAAVKSAIKQLLHKIFPDLHLENVVLELGISETDGSLDAHLIELNPAIRRTEVGLFDLAEKSSLDGSFRFRRASVPASTQL